MSYVLKLLHNFGKLTLLKFLYHAFQKLKVLKFNMHCDIILHETRTDTLVCLLVWERLRNERTNFFGVFTVIILPGK